MDRVLAQHDLAHHGLDVLALQLHLHGESVLEPGEHLVGRQRRLAGRNNQQPALELLGEALDQVLHLQQQLNVFADVLLQLVDDQQGQRRGGLVAVRRAARATCSRTWRIVSMTMSSERSFTW